MLDIKTLKSGSDVRGRALAADGKEAVLTPEIAGGIARAFLGYAAEKWGPISRLAVGHDSRLTAMDLKEGILKALKEPAAAAPDGGLTVLDCGLTTTPAMFMTTKFPETDCAAAIMLTASHMPKDMNGLKFFVKGGGLEGKDIERILERAATPSVSRPPLRRGEFLKDKFTDGLTVERENHFKIVKTDGLQVYRAFLKNKFQTETGKEKPLTGRKLAVDAGNGAGGFYAGLLEELGADVSGSRYLEPDGSFPNHIPNPEDESAMKAARAMVKESGAEAGIVFDADADRAGLVGRRGDINRNALIALCAKLSAREYPGCTIVTDSVTHRALTPYIEGLGCRHRRFKRGYRNVIDEARRLRKEGVNAVLAIETSGHAAFYDNSFLDDGAYLISYCLIRAAKLGKSFDELIADYKPPLEEKELRLPIAAADFKAAGADMLKRIEDEAKTRGWERIDGYEGIRVVSPEACLTARMSVHEPILVLNYESDIKGGCEDMHKIIRAVAYRA
ncbi:phosphoglucomutase [Clostridia bacterium]|nr:phosphoglucomutase [Clostridia bacterium]